MTISPKSMSRPEGAKPAPGKVFTNTDDPAMFKGEAVGDHAKLVAAHKRLGEQLRASANRAAADASSQGVTATQARTKAQDEDPNLIWTGTHYQQIG